MIRNLGNGLYHCTLCRTDKPKAQIGAAPHFQNCCVACRKGAGKVKKRWHKPTLDEHDFKFVLAGID